MAVSKVRLMVIKSKGLRIVAKNVQPRAPLSFPIVMAAPQPQSPKITVKNRKMEVNIIKLEVRRNIRWSLAEAAAL